MERIIDRFDKYMKFKGLNDNKVTDQLSLSIGLLGKSRKKGRDASKKLIEKILEFYTDIEKVWLMTGVGDMIVKAQPTTLQLVETKPDAVADPPVELFLCPECVNKKRVIDAQGKLIASLEEQIELLKFCLGKSRGTGSE